MSRWIAVTTSRTVWLSKRGTSKFCSAPDSSPRQTLTCNIVIPGSGSDATPKHRVLRVAVTMRRRVSGLHEAIHERFVGVVQRLGYAIDVFLPLGQRPRTGDHRTDDLVAQHPVIGELGRGHPASFGMRLD